MSNSRYNPKEIEAKWYQHWMDKDYFSSKPDDREPYTIVIPPPNVTGMLHMGHMLNNTIQDILIRKALSIGADKAVRIDSAASSSLFVAKQIAEYCKDKEFDVIFFGKETIDYNGSEVGSMVSELLDIPFVSWASNLEQDGEAFHVTRDIEGGIQKVEVSAPFAVSAAKGLAEQRIPNMKAIMMSKRKQVDVIEPVSIEEQVEIVHYEKPEDKSGVKLIDPDNMEELIRILKDEEKVL